MFLAVGEMTQGVLSDALIPTTGLIIPELDKNQLQLYTELSLDVWRISLTD